jgi:hypothetical protein
MTDHKYTIYKNGPFYSLKGFFKQIINPFNWKHIKWSWVRYSIGQFIDDRSPKDKFDAFMAEYKNRQGWFEEYGYKRNS